MKRRAASGEGAGEAPAGKVRLSADGEAALAQVLSKWSARTGERKSERAALSLGEAVSRERRVKALLAPRPRGPARLAAASSGEVQEVLLRTLPGGQFLLRSEGARLLVEWTGPGRPTLEQPEGWTVERQARPRGQPLCWILLRRGKQAALPALRARVGGRWWPLVHAEG